MASSRPVALVFLSALLSCSESPLQIESIDPRPILFIGNRQPNGLFGLYAVQGDGAQVRLVTFGAGQAVYPAWSPDALHVAYASGPSTGSQLWISHADGTNPELAHPSFPTCSSWTGVSWSPAGDRLTAACFGHLWVLRPSDGAMKEIASDSDGLSEWSPDGQWIAFSTESDAAIVKVKPDGTQRTVLIPNAKEPSWSPDGTQLAFISMTNIGNHVGIAVANEFGGDFKLLIAAKDGSGEGPKWSPDGRHITFFRGRPCPPEVGSSCTHHSVFVMRADGSRLKRITPDSLQATRPSW